MNVDFFWAFTTGLLGSTHCLGMCGPLVVAYSLHFLPAASVGTSALSVFSRERIVHHTAFHVGRITTYGFLGTVAAGLIGLGSFNEWLLFLRSTGLISLIGGLLMIFFGLALLRIFPLPFTDIFTSKQTNSYFSRFIHACLNSRALTAKFVLGLGVGFLPCMLSWAMVVRAATTENMAQGCILMIFFGLGTTPLIFFTGFFASVLTQRMRLAGERVAAVSVIIMGLILFFKVVKKLV